MKDPLVVTQVRFKEGSEADSRRGLLGFLSCVVNGTLRLDGVTLRRTRRGRLTLSFPAKPGLTGAQFFYFRPLDDAARKHIEQQVFKALGLTEGASR